MNTLIKVAADYMSSGLWDEQGHCIDVNDVNITDELKQRLEVYVSAYECNDVFLQLDGCTETMHRQAAAVNALGHMIAEQIAVQLPNNKIQFFDEIQNKWIDIN